MKYILTLFIAVSAVFSSALIVNNTSSESDKIKIEADNNSQMMYEMRTYTTYEGKLDALHQRFTDHTLRLFEKHGMTNVAYWIPNNPELRDNTLVFILGHESAEAAEANWEAFVADPEWQQAYEESHADGVIVQHAESIFMTATPYSPMQ